MRFAVIDIAGDMLADAVRFLTDAGLRVYASLPTDETAFDTVRIVFQDGFESILPDECGLPGWRLVRPVMVVQAYGSQRLTRVDRFEVIGVLKFSPNGRAKVEMPPLKDMTEERAAEARAGAILGAIADRGEAAAHG